MSRKFLDTNVFVYATDQTDPRKALLARKLQQAATNEFEGVVSHQVIHEYFNVAFKKYTIPLTLVEARRVLTEVFHRFMIVPSSSASILVAMELHKTHGLAWYDALIVAAAIQADCTELLTEDLQDGMCVGSLRVTNPFIDQPDSRH